LQNGAQAHICEMTPWFKVRKAAQVGAYFAFQQGGSINLMKLVKLVYLANRNAMAKYDYPIFDDHMVSMPHGPWTRSFSTTSMARRKSELIGSPS